MTPERFQRLRDVLQRRQPDLTVLMENVHKPHNYAAVLRSCDAVGCFEVHGILHDSNLSNKIASAAGALKWLQRHEHPSIEEALQRIRRQKLRVVAAHRSSRSRDYRSYDFTEPTCIVLGQELEGVTDRALALVDEQIHVPMYGMVESLNVSVAAAVILFEAERQRSTHGLYARQRLEPEVFRRTLFEWAQPEIAEYCRRRGFEYPALNEAGELAGKLPR